MNFAFLIKTNRKLIALAVVFSLLTTAVTLLQPAYVGTLLTAAGSGGITAPLIKLLGVLVGGAILSGLTMFVSSLAADKAVRELRRKLSRHLMALTVAKYEKRGAGGFVTRISSDTTIVSFDVRAGEKVALTGPSGSGKSTMLSLLLRFYEPTSGTILVDGATIADQSLFDLRGTVAYVEQEPNLLPGTLKENLLLGVAEPPTDSELIELLRQCGLSDFASQSGLRREVGAANSGVSGGERQRIAMIRAHRCDTR
ncbi:MAG: ATP-binding cassette domain-containing protein [Corynebacterium sp.]|uniref:ATP-binding cassette domain-containing protein n=1 Tax=Corynebacterium sp. TaxID=1720 RepID=UPI0026DAEDF0|nr:ATP-binding cassette domain-containing protein [Corynebacterium sp.]MDO5098634.1 ATP-binding cassette domain-containing protein [Corynebacterium sp.]